MTNSIETKNDVYTIYILKNTVNDLIYIGQTRTTTKVRFNNGKGYSQNPHLNSSIKLHGKDKFYYEVLGKVIDDPAQAVFYEGFYMDFYQALDPVMGYNLKEAGSVGKHSIETRKKMSISKKGKKKKPFTKEHRDNISKAKVGTKMPPKTEKARANISAALMGHGFEQSTLDKMSSAKKGKKLSPSHCANLSASKKGKCKYSIDDQYKMKELSDNGISANKISKIFKATHSTILRIIRRLGSKV